MSIVPTWLRKLFRFRVPSYVYFLTLLLFAAVIFYGYKERDVQPVLTGNEGSGNGCYISQVRLNDYDLIKPLLFTENEDEDPDLLGLKSELDSLIKSKISTGEITNASIYMKRMNDTRTIRLNPADTYNPGSMMKLPVMITYYREAMTNPQVLNQQILFTGHNNSLPIEEGAVDVLEKGKSYTVKQLIDYMIIDSDNDAMALLVNNITEEKLNKVFTDLGVPIPPTKNDVFNLTPEIYARFLRVLYNATYLDRNYSQQALQTLTKCKYNNGLTRNIPSDFKIAHKYGISTTGEFRSLSEAGIFYTANPYLFVIMTKGGDYAKLAGLISECSERVYSKINS